MMLYVQRRLNALYPCFSDDVDKVHKLLEGVDYRVTVTRPRNLAHHRKYWALIHLVYDNLPEELEGKFKTPDDLHFEIKMQTGYRERYVTLGGAEIYRAKSISFEKMDQTEFEGYYDSALVVICKYILPGITKEEIINQLTQF